ncbi:MAG: AMP-binding protein [Xenococcaceae cyanobacterium MO_234.B1]|nr:AMP-binding protein [Xenococcaceae cyanobacterium MO_234.B1]
MSQTLLQELSNSDNDKLDKLSTLVDLLHYRALHQPEQTAYTFLPDGETESDSLTYQELDQQARAIAASLQYFDASSERALLLYPPGLEFIAAFFGCLYAGVVAVPAYPPRRNQNLFRLLSIVASSQAKMVLTTTSELANIESRLAENPELAGLHWLATDNLKSDQAASWQELALCGDTLAFLQYTSGSTGTPKGVMVSHGNLLHNERLIEMGFGHTADTLVVGWLPLFHDMGLIGNVLQPLYLGRPSILMSPVAFLQKPWRWLQAIDRYKATTSGGPNFAYDLCVEKITTQQLSGLNLSSWSVAFNGAEPVRAETLERFARHFAPCGFRARAFYPCYGMAETTLFVSGGLKSAPPVLRQVERAALEPNRVVAAAENQADSRTIVGCGLAFFDKIVIVNPESHTRCRAERVGEIWVSGLSVTQGYWNQPELTEQTFKAYLADTGEGPFLRTGDLGFIEDGELFITGRIKELIIIRGRNYYPQDIELTVENSHRALRSHCSAAFSVERSGEEGLVVACEVKRTYLRKLNVAEIARTIRRAVSEEFELQVHSVLLLKTNSLLKTSSGKIQRRACRSAFLNGTLNVVGCDELEPSKQSGFQTVVDVRETTSSSELQLVDSHLSGLGRAPDKITESDIQDWLQARLAHYLQVSPHQVDVDEPLASYGLDSSVAITVTEELEKLLGCELDPAFLFWEYPTIEEMASYLSTPEVLGTASHQSLLAVR